MGENSVHALQRSFETHLLTPVSSKLANTQPLDVEILGAAVVTGSEIEQVPEGENSYHHSFFIK